MRAIFADTSYFVALCGPNDAFHKRAVEVGANLIAKIITTEYILVEAGGLLLRPADRPAYVNLVRDLESDPGVEIVPASPPLFQSGFDLFARRPDKEWSLIDCISFVVMHQKRLKEALSTDKHFVQAGFAPCCVNSSSSSWPDIL